MVCACVLLITTAAWGTMNISFDENGHGDVDGTKLVWGMGIPPQAGEYDQYATLYYELPNTVVEGDLVIYETLQGPYSDVLRFVNVGSTTPIGRVYVYSDNSDGVDALADTGIPGTLISTLDARNEQGTENGWNGLVYTAYYISEGQYYSPGYMEGETVTYNFTSDVPEPATICLLSIGALGLLRNRRFR
ncbi:MAG: PEP-CTERM sorting domain-containing protein [Sedimentisphaerales bacterium]